MGDGIADTTHFSGDNTFDVSDPLDPSARVQGITAQRGWSQIVLNGSGLGFAAVGPNSTSDGPHHVSIYDVNDVGTFGSFLAEFETPGLAQAVSIYNGIGYVADTGAGLQTVNYLAYDTETLFPNGFTLVGDGPDGEFGTHDDETRIPSTLEYRERVLGAFIHLPEGLVPGRYRATVSSNVSDLAGNTVEPEFAWEFVIYDVNDDTDNDCLPDALEIFLGLDPELDNSDSDSTLDGEEDSDGDGLSNCGEVLLGLDPTDPDTDANGIADGAEDADVDGLSNGDEVRHGTDPLNPDTDQDGWPDGAEVDGGSDPLDPQSTPPLTIVSTPRTSVALPGIGDAGNLRPNTTSTRPPVSLVLPSTGDLGELSSNTVLAQPPVSVVLPNAGDLSDLQANTVLARPPVSIILPSAGNLSELQSNTVLARPPASVILSGDGDLGGLQPNTTISHPRASVVLPGSGDAAVLKANTTVAQPSVTVGFDEL